MNGFVGIFYVMIFVLPARLVDGYVGNCRSLTKREENKLKTFDENGT